MFEDGARAAIKLRLNLGADNLPIRANRKLKLPERDYGDVDFAFIWKGVLINLELKSWQKTPEYFRGDFKAVDNRQKELEKQLMTKATPRGYKLQELLSKEKPSLSIFGTLTFLCVADVEYVSPQYQNLWYGDVPRALTPAEIVELLTDRPRFEHVLNAAGIHK